MLKTIENPKIQNSGTKDECSHHWVIESPGGRQSLGVCKRCGAKKLFFNSFDEETVKPKIPRINELNEYNS